MHRLSLGYFSKHEAGDVMSRFTNDTWIRFNKDRLWSGAGCQRHYAVVLDYLTMMRLECRLCLC